MSSPAPRSRYAALLLTVLSATVFFAETSLFHLVIFSRNYLDATVILVSVLLGMAVGAVVAAKRQLSDAAVSVLASLFVISTLLCMANILFLPEFYKSSPLLWLPYTFAGVLLGHLFRTYDAGRMYAYDLIGAVVGVGLSVTLIPLVRVENSIFAAGILLAGLCTFDAIRGRRPADGSLAATVLIFCVAAFSYNLNVDLINAAKIGRCSDDIDSRKIFCWKYKNVLYSRDTLIQRVDVLFRSDNSRYVAYDGFSNDSFFQWGNERYVYDQRLVHGIIKDPDILIIGAAAEGILKPAKNETTPDKIDAIEINPAIAEMMQGRYFELSGKAYEGINLIQTDANTYLYHTEKKYDIITLLNTHLVKTLRYYGGPEYLHTAESIRQYFDHLKPNGHIMIEEREKTVGAVTGMYRIISTFYRVMQERGFEHPEDNIAVWAHNFNTGAAARPQDIDTSDYYVNVMFKNGPINDADRAAIADWSLHARRVDMMWLPGTETKTKELRHLFSTLGVGYRYYDAVTLMTITDDRPFPFHVDGNIASVGGVFWRYAVGIVPGLLALVAYGLSRPEARPRRLQAGGLYVASLLLGMAYMLVEIFLMQRYHKFMGGAVYSLVFVMGALLLTSGLGSLFSARLGLRGVTIATLGVPVLLLLHFFVGKDLLASISATPLVNGVWVAFTVLPLGALMGMPFPWLLEQARSRLHEEHVPLYVATSLLAGALGVLLSQYLSVLVGFALTLGVAVGAYLVSALLLPALGRGDGADQGQTVATPTPADGNSV